jgi:hypothetical protein
MFMNLGADVFAKKKNQNWNKEFIHILMYYFFVFSSMFLILFLSAGAGTSPQFR